MAVLEVGGQFGVVTEGSAQQGGVEERHCTCTPGRGSDTPRGGVQQWWVLSNSGDTVWPEQRFPTSPQDDMHRICQCGLAARRGELLLLGSRGAG